MRASNSLLKVRQTCVVLPKKIYIKNVDLENSPKLHGNIEGVVYITIFITVAVPVNNMQHALRYIIVTTGAATGSRLVCQLLHTGDYVAPPKKITLWKIAVDILVSYFDLTPGSLHL